MDEKPVEEKFTVKDLPVALEVMLQIVLGSYMFFFIYHNILPVVSIVVSSFALLTYTRFAVYELLGHFETDKVLLGRGELSNPTASAWLSWRRFGLQMIVGFLILAPPLVITLMQRRPLW